MKLKISTDGIIYDDETQAAVGFLGTDTPDENIAWASLSVLAEVMRAAEKGRITILLDRRMRERRQT